MAAAEEEVKTEIEAPEPTLREQLEAARDEAIAKQTGDDGGIQPEPKRNAETSVAGRERDASGRFVPATQTESTSATFDPAKGTQTQAGDGSITPAANAGVQQQPAPQTLVNDAPQGWTAAEKTLWASIPQPARAAIQRREADFHRKLTEHDEVRNIGNEFMRTAAEYAPVVRQTGMAPAALWRQYLDMVRMVQTADPARRAAIFRDLAARNGADLSGLQAGSNPAPSPSAIPPELQTMTREWQDFKRQQLEYQTRQEQEKQSREQAEMQETASEIEVFRSKPENVHFDAVKDLMASILRGGVASTLEEAYQLAVKAHPQVSAQIEQERQAVAQKAAAEKQKLEAARRKAGSVRSGPGGNASSAQPGSIREELQKAFAESRSRI